MHEKPINEFVSGKNYQHFYSMEIWEMFANFVLVAGMTLIFLIILFLIKSRKQLSQRLLIVFFASCFFFLLYYYGYLYRIRVVGGIAILFGSGMGYLLGPILYFYVKSLAFPGSKVLKSLLTQLTPYYLYWTFVALPLSISMFSSIYMQDFGKFFARYADYFNIIENIFLLAYAFASIKLLSKLKGLFQANYSNLDNRDLLWCKQLITGLTGIIFLDIIFSVYELIYPPLTWNIGMVIAFLIVGFFGYLGYKGMMQSRILLPEFLLKAEIDTVQTVSLMPGMASPERSVSVLSSTGHLDNYSEEEIREMINKLYKVLEEEKPYLDESLTLSDLADRINLSDKKLSELLNRYVETSFYDFVNDYRVEAVKEKLLSPDYQNLTLLAIAFDSGFKSKTSFNRVFKSKTGFSPSQYKRNLLNGVKVKRIEA